MKSYQKSWILSQYKAAELEIFWGEDHCNISWFTFKVESREKCDHPGFFFELSLLRLFSFNFFIYDGRHWNWEEDRFFEEGEEEKYYNDEITTDSLGEEGWEYIEKCPFLGYPIWQKDKNPNDIGSYSPTFIYDPQKSEVIYSTGEFSTVRRKISSRTELRDFYRILKVKK